MGQILGGFTPGGIVGDIRDLSYQWKLRSPSGIVFAGIGFVPGIGDEIKLGFKYAIHKLPKLGGKKLNEIENILIHYGFERIKPFNENLRYWSHCDGSLCRIDLKDRLGSKPHLHKNLKLKNEIIVYDDFGNVVNYRSKEAHIEFNYTFQDEK